MSTTHTPKEVTGRSRLTGEVTYRRTFYFTEEELAAIERAAAEEIGAAGTPRASSPTIVVQKAVRRYCNLPIPTGDSPGA